MIYSRKLFITTVLLCFAIAVLDAQIPDMNKRIPDDKNIRIGILTNGMKYYVRYNPKPEKRAEMRLVVNAGSTAEDDNQQGLAHLCEHMCFNGTKNFKKSELVDYLESIGTKFGAHLNAYTSFDETVYMLQLPTDKNEIITKGLQILEDWAHNVTFDSVEIDKERGVVIEEWRLGQGAQERTRRQYWPVLFRDSRYADRLPIGKKDIIENFPQQRIKDFYNDWYRPDLMAIAVVGDFNVDTMEAMVKEKFGHLTNRKDEPQLQAWPIPDHENNLICVAKDKELSSTTIQIIYKHEAQPQGSYASYRASIVHSLYAQMLNMRLSEISKKADAPFLYGGGGYSSLVRTKDAFSLVSVAKPNAVDAALQSLITESERVIQHGFTLTELERAKKTYLRQMENAYRERDKQQSRALVDECVRNFLVGEPMPGIERELELSRLFVPAIHISEINDLSKFYFTGGKNEVIILTAPDRPDVKLPTEDDIRRMIDASKRIEVKPYEDKVVDKQLMEIMPSPVTIISETKNEKLNITEWKLPNGATVSFKPTDFKNDEIIMQSFRLGGYSNAPEAQLRSAMIAASMVDASGVGSMSSDELEKYMTGKNAGLSPYISEYTEGVSGQCSPEDLELMMQLLYQYFEAPRLDEDIFASQTAQLKAVLQNKTESPESNFRDTLNYVMSNYHPRAKPMTALRVNEIIKDNSFDFYKQRFDGVHGMYFCFVGNIDERVFKKMVETYIASLPRGNTEATYKNNDVKPPQGQVERYIYKGTEPKSNVALKITGTFENTRKNRIELTLLMRLLSIKLRESMREDKSGVYGVSATAGMSKFPESSYDITINFGCAPANVEMLIRAALTEIELLKKNGPDTADIVKVRETALRERESDLKDNGFWRSALYNQYYYGDNINDIFTYNDIVSELNSESYKQLATKYLDMKNFARFVLLPEKK